MAEDREKFLADYYPEATGFEEAGSGWDEGEHPRGKTVPGTNSGSFAPKVQFVQAPADKFIEWRDKYTPERWQGYLSPLKPEDLPDHKLLTTEDGYTGVAVSADGDIQNLYSGGPAKGKGFGVDAVFKAIADGGRTLDCFDGYLPHFYKQFGFVEVGRMVFDPAQAPPKWNFQQDDNPDIVFMAWKGFPTDERTIREVCAAGRKDQRYRINRNTGRYYADWDRAKMDTRRAVDPRGGGRE